MDAFSAMSMSTVKSAGYYDIFGRFHLMCPDGYYRQKKKGKPLKQKLGLGPEHSKWRPIAPHSS